jgi:hypothetical protein
MGLAAVPTGSHRTAALPFPLDLARHVALSLAERNEKLFHHFPDIRFDDLVQIALQGMIAEWPKYNPAKASPSTYLYTVAWGDIRDLSRKRERQAKWEGEAAWLSGPQAPPLVEGEPTNPFHALTVAQWVGRVYAHAKRAIPQREGPGRPSCYPKAVACVALMRRLKLSCRGVVLYLRDNPNVAQAVAFAVIPSHDWFWRANYLTENLGVKMDGLGE